MADIRTLENVAAKARWLRSCEKQLSHASVREDIFEINRIGQMVMDAKQALDHALQNSDV